MKMLKGELSEVRYTWPEDKLQSIEDSTTNIGCSDDNSEEEYDGESLKELSRCTLDKDGVCYINGKYYTFFLNVYTKSIYILLL